MLVKLVCSRVESITCNERKRLKWGLYDIEKGICRVLSITIYCIPFGKTVVRDLGKGIRIFFQLSEEVYISLVQAGCESSVI